MMKLYYRIYDYIYDTIRFRYEWCEEKFWIFYKSETGVEIRTFIDTYFYNKFYLEIFLDKLYYPITNYLTTGYLYKNIFNTYWYTSLLILFLVCFYARQSFRLYKFCWWYIITVLYEEDLVGKRYVSYLGMVLTLFWWLGILNMSMLLTYHSWYQFGFYPKTFDFMAFCDYHFRWYFTLFRSIFFIGYPTTPYDHMFPDNIKAKLRKAGKEIARAQRQELENFRTLSIAQKKNVRQFEQEVFEMMRKQQIQRKRKLRDLAALYRTKTQK